MSLIERGRSQSAPGGRGRRPPEIPCASKERTHLELETALATWTKRYNEEFLHSTLGYERPIEYKNWFYHATRREVPSLMSRKFLEIVGRLTYWPPLQKGTNTAIMALQQALEELLYIDSSCGRKCDHNPSTRSIVNQK